MMMTTMMEEMTWDERQSFQSSHPERRVGYPEDLQEKEKAKAEGRGASRTGKEKELVRRVKVKVKVKVQKLE